MIVIFHLLWELMVIIMSDVKDYLYSNCKKEIIDSLKSHNILHWFDNIMSYTGDDNLNSSCNDEYNLDIDECLITNGISNKVLARINNGSEVKYITSVRGATYVIILKYNEYVAPIFDLRIDEPRYINTVEEIDRTLKRIERCYGYDQMRYYLNEWRTGREFIIKDNNQI